MRILNFINGCFMKKCVQVNIVLFMVIVLMLSNYALSDEKLEALDKEFVEFLGLYDVNDEEILKLALDSDTEEQEQITKIKGEE